MRIHLTGIVFVALSVAGLGAGCNRQNEPETLTPANASGENRPTAEERRGAGPTGNPDGIDGSMYGPGSSMSSPGSSSDTGHMPQQQGSAGSANRGSNAPDSPDSSVPDSDSGSGTGTGPSTVGPGSSVR